MIYPSLFIGLGSTGLEILEKFQELVYEHYERPALDIFRYVAIESRRAAELRQTDWGDNKIQLLKPVITSTDSISRALALGHKTYLQDWLDPRLLNIQGGDFTDGASNIRMAGRLILWENWTEISKAITGALDSIKGEDERAESRDFLKKHYQRHGRNIDRTDTLVGGLPNIYIVGTLCGGTCSGMFVDIAYHLKQVAALWQENRGDPDVPKVHGLFSTFDHASLMSGGGEKTRTHPANSWAALLECDFFCHPQTRYRCRFPDQEFIDTNERPLDVLYLLSCTADTPKMSAKSNFRRKGDPDIKSLNHMIATLMFSETVGALLEAKDAISSDYRGKPRALRTNAAHHSPCISTCGIATIWYPKFRIARGAACGYGQAICESILREVSPDSEHGLDGKVQKAWEEMLRDATSKLESHGTGTLENLIRQEFKERRDDDLGVTLPRLRKRLEARVNSHLARGEKVDVEIGKRSADFVDELKGRIHEFVAGILNEHLRISDAKHCLKKLDKLMHEYCDKFPRDYPSPSTATIRTPDRSRTARLVFASVQVERRLREDLLEDISNYMCRHISQVRNFYMRTLLEKVRRTSIGVGLEQDESEKQAGKQTESKALEKIRRDVEGCRADLEKRYGALTEDFESTQDVRFVFKNGSLREDIDTLVAGWKSSPKTEMRAVLEELFSASKRTGAKYLGHEDSESRQDVIEKELREHLVPEALRELTFNAFSVVEDWNSTDLAEFSKHGLPHLELSDGVSGLASRVIAGGQPVSFVAGAGGEAKLSSLLKTKLAGTEVADIFHLPIAVPELSHMILFYREEPLIYMDENIATSVELRKAYESVEFGEGVPSRSGDAVAPTLHTHKAGSSAFDPSVFYRRHMLDQEFMPIARKLLSVSDSDGSWRSSEIFQVENGRLIMRGKKPDGSLIYYTGDENGVEVCAADPELFDDFVARVRERLSQLDYHEYMGRFNQYLKLQEERIEADGGNYGVFLRDEQQAMKNLSLVREFFGDWRNAGIDGER